MQKSLHLDARVNLNYDGIFNHTNPPAFVSGIDNESYMFHEMVRRPHKDDFVRVMMKEVENHTIRGYWKIMKQSEIGSAKTIKEIWFFKRKRRPDGSLSRRKVHLCVYGRVQEFGDTY